MGYLKDFKGDLFYILLKNTHLPLWGPVAEDIFKRPGSVAKYMCGGSLRTLLQQDNRVYVLQPCLKRVPKRDKDTVCGGHAVRPLTCSVPALSWGEPQRSRTERRLRLPEPAWSAGRASRWPNSSSRECRSMGNSSSPVAAPLHTLFLPSTCSYSFTRFSELS